MDKEDNMIDAPLRLRDIDDVHGYVLDAVELLAPAARDRRDALHAHGVRAVLRVERALPPGVPLLPVLEDVLPPRLAAVHEGLARTGDRTDDLLAAVA
jgi:hypothetical protein